MYQKKKIEKVFAIMKKNNPEPRTELNYENKYPEIPKQHPQLY